MTDRPGEIVIRNWDRFQHYKKRNPPWIRLYRDVIDKSEYRALSDSAARLLFELWLLASEVEPGGRVPHDLNLIAWKTGRSSTENGLWKSLQELAEQGFITLASTNASTNASKSTPQRQSTETEGREQSTEPPHTPPRVVEKVEYTQNELYEAANDVLGLERLQSWERKKNYTLLNDWLYSSDQQRDAGMIWAAIHGTHAMREAGEIDWLKPGTPAKLAVLVKSQTLRDQGDGKSVATLWDVATDRYYQGEPVEVKRSGADKGPQRLAIEITTQKGAA